jgi:hypothetical protein
MNKLRILREVEQAILVHLEADGIRLYLLLLANSGENGEGNIGYRTIRKALGTDFHASRVIDACRDLRGQGLIEVISPPPDNLAEHDFALIYRIVPARGK